MSERATDTTPQTPHTDDAESSSAAADGGHDAHDAHDTRETHDTRDPRDGLDGPHSPDISASGVAGSAWDTDASVMGPEDLGASTPDNSLDALDAWTMDGQVAPDVGDLPGEAGADSESESTGRPANRVRLLEREGEVAADFLERLLDIADLDGDIEVDIDGDRAAVAIVDSEDGRVPRRLVGTDGKVLDALQELTRLAVQAETGERSRLMLDVAGHRAQRRVALLDVARTVIAEVTATGEQKALEDMTAFERKIVHDEVAAAGLDSESEGVEPHRHIVVFPA